MIVLDINMTRLISMNKNTRMAHIVNMLLLWIVTRKRFIYYSFDDYVVLGLSRKEFEELRKGNEFRFDELLIDEEIKL